MWDGGKFDSSLCLYKKGLQCKGRDKDEARRIRMGFLEEVTLLLEFFIDQITESHWIKIYALLKMYGIEQRNHLKTALPIWGNSEVSRGSSFKRTWLY